MTYRIEGVDDATPKEADDPATAADLILNDEHVSKQKERLIAQLTSMKDGEVVILPSGTRITLR